MPHIPPEYLTIPSCANPSTGTQLPRNDQREDSPHHSPEQAGGNREPLKGVVSHESGARAIREGEDIVNRMDSRREYEIHEEREIPRWIREIVEDDAQEQEGHEGREGEIRMGGREGHLRNHETVLPMDVRSSGQKPLPYHRLRRGGDADERDLQMEAFEHAPRGVHLTEAAVDEHEIR